MDLNPPSQLRAAFEAGAVRLVDEYAQPLTFSAALDRTCWAHLRDASDGRVYVQKLQNSRDLLRPKYQELLGLGW